VYKLIDISDRKGIAELEQSLDAEFDPKKVGDFLRQTLSDAVKALIVEAPYVDKDYRSTYYNYYAKKGSRHNPYCVRIHCFKQPPVLGKDLMLRHSRGSSYEGLLTHDYLGFLVIRPLKRAAIGRTVLDPVAIRGFKGNVMRSDHVVHY
jgi:hypothetical protein